MHNYLVARETFTIAVNFKQSSYEVTESDTVTITIVLNQPSSIPFQVAINTTDITATGKVLVIIVLIML